MINSIGGEQDNVVFLGRRSFRMEVVGQPDEEEMAIPTPVHATSTQKLFMSDDGDALRDATSRAPAARGISRLTLIAMCAATFIFGVAVTLTFGHRAEKRAPAAPVVVRVPVVVAPAPAPIPEPAPVVVSRPLAKSMPTVHARPAPVKPAPRAVRRTPAPPPAPKPWVDPFAE